MCVYIYIYIYIHTHTHTHKHHYALSLKVDGMQNVIGFELSKRFMMNVFHLLFYILTNQKHLQQNVVKLWLYFRVY